MRPKYDKPKMTQQKLQMELEDLPQNWKNALCEVKVNDQNNDDFPSCVKTCGVCG